jgi:hypothetical protein
MPSISRTSNDCSPNALDLHRIERAVAGIFSGNPRQKKSDGTFFATRMKKGVAVAVGFAVVADTVAVAVGFALVVAVAVAVGFALVVAVALVFAVAVADCPRTDPFEVSKKNVSRPDFTSTDPGAGSAPNRTARFMMYGRSNFKRLYPVTATGRSLRTRSRKRMRRSASSHALCTVQGFSPPLDATSSSTSPSVIM